jgi:hypothetical protein
MRDGQSNYLNMTNAVIQLLHQEAIEVLEKDGKRKRTENE